MTPEEIAAKEAEDKAAAEATAKAEADRIAAEEAAKVKNDPDHFKKEADKHAREAAALRERLRASETEAATLKKAEEDRKKAEMSEIDRLKLENEQATKKAEEATKKAREASVKVAASKLGFTNPDLAVKLISIEDIKEDESNIESLVKKVLTDNPYLAGAKVTVPGRNGAGPSAVTEAEIDKETTEAAKTIFPAMSGRHIR